MLFTAPGAVEVCTEEMAPPQGDELLIETVVSAISAGTEMLFYRGQVPAGMAADSAIAGLTDAVRYPLKYGYACVGRVCEVADPLARQAETTEADGPIDAAGAEDTRYYFAFHPHESHFYASPQALLPVPEGILPRQAALLPNAETAVNLVMDGAPLVGERAVVMGLGIVGLLTTALLAQFPLAALIAVDPLPHRRRLARRLGASQAIDPSGADQLRDALADGGERHGVDLIYELSGQPTALDAAVSAAGFDSRIVVGSWYGTKPATLHLGGSFHRNRIRLISSQVSTIAPQLRGRWTKARRMESAWQLLAKLPAEELISHRFPLDQADEAYRLIDSCPEQTLQVILDYSF